MKAYFGDALRRLDARINLNYGQSGLYFIDNDGEHTVPDKEFIKVFRDYQNVLRNNCFVSLEDYFGSYLEKDPRFLEYVEGCKTAFYKKIFFEAPTKIKNIFEKLFDVFPFNEDSVPRHELYNTLKGYINFKEIRVNYSSFVPNLCLNIELGTNSDLRSDFTAILSAFRDNASDLELQKKTYIYNNALSKLINIQGYSVPMVVKAYYVDDQDTGSDFVDSLVSALKNFNGEKAALFLLSYTHPNYSNNATLSFLQFVASAEVCAKAERPRVNSDTHIDYNNSVVLGIYDPSRKGEPQFIKLEKDVQILFDQISGVTFQNYEQSPLQNYSADSNTLVWSPYNFSNRLFLRNPIQRETLDDIVTGIKTVQTELFRGLD